ncbi:Protein of unknown function [Cotesia congregata]|uniref:Uncharacterized protein n=1 Tax=Cotesia congregata TaxID=51543 RepID=A0A8J2MXW9_COTCN|nr:Protein of unknown function [Cotesia congregata]
MNKHHAIQLKKGKNAFRANSRIFYDRNIQTKAKLICYQLLVRPIISYAAPIWWDVGLSVMEKYRKFERSCLKTCLGRYRSAESNYIKRLSNKEIYDLADIRRFDNFCLTLTRNYFSTMYEIGNDTIKNLEIENNKLVRIMAGSNYNHDSLDRLNEKYWWLHGEAKHLDELRRRARIKKQQFRQQQRVRPLLNSRRRHRQ